MQSEIKSGERYKAQLWVYTKFHAYKLSLHLVVKKSAFWNWAWDSGYKIIIDYVENEMVWENTFLDVMNDNKLVQE